MPMRRDAELPGNGERGVVASVVDEQDSIDDVVRDRRVALRKRLFRAIRGHDDGDAVTVQHEGGVADAGLEACR